MNETVTLKFKASGQILKSAVPAPIYASKTVNYLFAEFELGSGWDGFDSIRAVWQSNSATVASLLDGTDGTCVIPAEVLNSVSPVAVNLVGSIEEGGVLTDQLTTFPVLALTVHTSAFVFGTETPDITPSLFEQFINAARNQVITGVEATTLETGFPATVEFENGVMKFGLPKGSKGDTGDSPVFTVGNVVTGEAGSSVQVYLSGTDENPVLNFTIPRGNPGELIIAQNGLLVDDDGFFYVNLND